MTPNVTASLFDGDLELAYDCIGEAQCSHATYYVEPPRPGDECTSQSGGNCWHLGAARQALAALHDKIAEELMRLNGEEED